MLSRLQLFQGDAEAADELRQEARESLESYIAEHPEDLEARITWARCLLDGEEWNRLTQVLDRLRDLETDSDYRDRLGTLSLAASQSQSLASPAGAERAIRFARWAFPLLSDPRPAAWRQIELASQGIAVPSEATGEIRDWLDQSLDVQADDASLWVLRGKLAEVSEDRDAAEQGYKRAAELEPDFLPELGSFYRRQGNTKQLAETDQKIIDYFEPQLAEDPEAYLARTAIAEAYADQGRWQEARELLSVDADNPRLRLTLATICTREFDA
jgi:tetratricopeptide (TPR) repeat protein